MTYVSYSDIQGWERWRFWVWSWFGHVQLVNIP